MTAKEAIAAFMAWGPAWQGPAWCSPEALADGLLKRLAHEGYVVVPVADIKGARRELMAGLVTNDVLDRLKAMEEQQQKQFAGKVG